MRVLPVLLLCALTALPAVFLLPPAEGATFTLFQERFEGAWPDPWSVGDDNLDAGADYWGVSSHETAQGNGAAWAAQEGTNSNSGLPNSVVHRQDDSMDAYMRTEIGDLSGYGALTLRFAHWIEAGTGDVFSVRVSEDGASWTVLWSVAGPIGRGWTTVELDLPLSSQFLEFRYITADSHTEGYEGVYVDSVEVRGEDDVPPTLTVLSPQDGSWVPTQDVTFSWRAEDDASGVDFVEVRVDGGAWMNLGQATSLLVEGMDEGSHIVDLRAVDGAGNVALVTVDVGVDVSPPSLVLQGPAEGTVSTSSTVAVAWAGADDVSDVAYAEVRLDDGAWVRVEAGSTHDLIGVSDGDHVVTVRVVDSAGNAQEASAAFQVNTNPLHPQGPGQGVLLYGLVAAGVVGLLLLLHRKGKVDLRKPWNRVKGTLRRLGRGSEEA